MTSDDSAGAGPDGPVDAAGPIDVVLFDLDGTITDSESGITATYVHTLEQLGRQVESSALRACIGPPLTVSLASLGVRADEMEEAVQIWRAWFGVHGIFDNDLYAGVPEMLERVRATGVWVGLATSKLREYAVQILDHFELTSYFDPIAGATRDGRLRHKEDIIAEALLELGVVGSERVLMVGDREHDMFGAAANRVLGVGVTYGYGSREELEAGGARWIVDTPAAVADLVEAQTAG